jgi:hypothetical protein
MQKKYESLLAWAIPGHRTAGSMTRLEKVAMSFALGMTLALAAVERGAGSSDFCVCKLA